MIVGITGGTGSGKTTLLKTAEALGFRVLDCDAIYHELLETDPSLLAAIEDRFPAPWNRAGCSEKSWGRWFLRTPKP